METIHGQHEGRKNLALNVLSWLVKARRTLTFDELQVAVCVEHQRYELNELDLPDRVTILDVCASLVMIDEDTRTVRLVHYTAQEYILKHPILLGAADFNVAMACTTYLSFGIFAQGACASQNNLVSRLRSHPFLKYAASHLFSHLRACDEALSTEVVLGFVKRLGNIDSFQQVLHHTDNYY